MARNPPTVLFVCPPEMGEFFLALSLANRLDRSLRKIFYLFGKKPAYPRLLRDPSGQKYPVIFSLNECREAAIGDPDLVILSSINQIPWAPPRGVAALLQSAFRSPLLVIDPAGVGARSRIRRVTSVSKAVAETAEWARKSRQAVAGWLVPRPYNFFSSRNRFLPYTVDEELPSPYVLWKKRRRNPVSVLLNISALNLGEGRPYYEVLTNIALARLVEKSPIETLSMTNEIPLWRSVSRRIRRVRKLPKNFSLESSAEHPVLTDLRLCICPFNNESTLTSRLLRRGVESLHLGLYEHGSEVRLGDFEFFSQTVHRCGGADEINMREAHTFCANWVRSGWARMQNTRIDPDCPARQWMDILGKDPLPLEEYMARDASRERRWHALTENFFARVPPVDQTIRGFL